MNVKQIIQILQKNELFVSTSIADLTREIKGKPRTDNRLLHEGDMFICIKGHRFDGHTFIPSAQKTGVGLIIQQTPICDDYPTIQVNNTRKAAALIVALYHGNPASQLKIIGVTGTNGKTTTTMLIFQTLMLLGKKCGWIGTLGYHVNDIHKSTDHTTPDIEKLQEIFTEMVQAGCEYVVMEVSSHALALDRVYGVPFYVSMFTNLSRDHLDFHLTMTEYARCKYLLFEYTRQNSGVVVINIDDKYGSDFYSKLRHDIATMGDKIVGEGIQDENDGKEESQKCVLKSLSLVEGDYLVKDSHFDLFGSHFTLQTAYRQYEIRSQLIGTFNVLNLALTVALLDLLDIPQDVVETLIPKLQTVPGRLQKVPNDRGIGVYVDYAHTSDALGNVLQSLSQLKRNRLLCLFGAGGDRDKGKRNEMLTIALEYADAVVITDDNPRYENPNQIIIDIIGETDLWAPWWIIRDRHRAIESLIAMANDGDIVLIAGKGNEKYQEIEGTKLYFDDYQIAVDALCREDRADERLVLPVDKLMLEILFSQNLHNTNPMTSIKPEHFTRISTDSRTISENSIFFALKGENYDGHDYVSQALKSGNTIAVVEHRDRFEHSCIVTDDAAKAMGKLCRKYLQMFPAYRIALSGSTGKTSTKEFIYNILSSVSPTLKTNKNENNIIGLCKTIQKIKPQHRFAIFEIGTNHFGEVAHLAEVADPQCGIVLNVGPSHLEAFGDEDGVFWEETALFRRSLNKMIYCGDDERFAVFSTDGISVGKKIDNQYRIDNVSVAQGGLVFTVNGMVYHIPQPIPFYAVNAGFAVATALELGIDHVSIRQSLMKELDLDLRMKFIKNGDGTLIVDCYNANPVSMQSAIEVFFDVEPNLPHVAILGDMLELGDSEVLYHKMIGAILGDRAAHTLITVGVLSNHYHSHRNGDYRLHFDTTEALIESEILKDIPSQVIILVKASHGIHLERIIPHIQTRRT